MTFSSSLLFFLYMFYNKDILFCIFKVGIFNLLRNTGNWLGKVPILSLDHMRCQMLALFTSIIQVSNE
jgi:hypothetical protein